MYNKKIKSNSTESIKEVAKYIIENNQNYNSVEREMAIEDWNRYYSNFDSRFNYLTKIGQFNLPVIERKIPLQKRYIDFLVSKKNRRPFKYNVYIDSEEFRKTTYDEELHVFINYVLMRSKSLSHENQLKIMQIDKKVKELNSMLAEQEKAAQEGGTQVDPILYEQVEQFNMSLQMVKDELNSQLINGKEIIDDYTIESSMTPNAILEKILTKFLKYVERVLKFNKISTNSFKSKIITGATAYMVAKFNNGEFFLREIKHSMITYPKDSTNTSINKKDWAYYTELMTPAQLDEFFGDELRDNYGSEIINVINSGYNINKGSNQMFALPDGGAVFGDTNYGNNYSNDRKVTVKWLWFRGSFPVSRKTVTDKNGIVHKHIINDKKVINIDDYIYKNNEYVNKKNKTEKYKKESVSTYSKSKGDIVETKYKNKLFHAILIDDQYYINCEEWKNIVYDVDNYNRFNLPIFGPSFDDETSQKYSLIEATNDIQDLIDIVHIAREYQIAVAGTKSSIIDISQKPDYMSSEEWEMNMKLGRYYIQTMDSNGMPKRTSFNQFQSFDNSISQGVQYYQNILDSLANLMGQIIGISYQSLGEVVATDQVKSNQIAINQTSLMTESLFMEHSELDKEVLEEYLNLKVRGLNNEDYLFSEVDHSGTKQFVLQSKRIGNNNIKVNLYNSGEDYQKIEDLKRIALQMHSELKMHFSTVIKIWNSETVAEMEAKVKHYEIELIKYQEQQASNNYQNSLETQKQIKQLDTEMKAYILGVEDKFKQTEYKLKTAELQLKQRELEFNQEIKMKEFKLSEDVNNINFIKVKEDTAVEKAMLQLDDKHQTIDEQIRMLELQVNARNNQMINKIKSKQAVHSKRSEKDINDN
jgi:hypothetical protein